jgi:heparin/heparan-sulfate lyase
MIWRGLDELVCRGGYYWGTENPYHHNFFTRTVAHNCVLIYDPNEPIPFYGGFMTANDGGQLRGDPLYYPASWRVLAGNNPYFYRGEIRTFVDDPKLTYVFADVTPAYNGAKAVRVTRSFLWLKPSTFVVCDWVASTQADTAKRWLLHSANKPRVDGAERVVAGAADAGILESSDTHLVTVERGASNLFLQTLLPERAVVRRIGGEGYGLWADGKNWEPPTDFRTTMDERRKQELAAAEATKRFWRIEIEPKEQSAEVVFLNVLDATAKDSATPAAAGLLRRDGAIGATLNRGDAPCEVLFCPDGRLRFDGKMLGKALEPLKPYSMSDREKRKAAR